MTKILLSFFDFTGEWSKPYSEDMDWEVKKYDIKNGFDILNFHADEFMSDYLHSIQKYSLPEIGLLFAVPCTDYALSGAAWFKMKDLDGRTSASNILVDKVKEIIDWFQKAGILSFYAIENPMSRIHSIHKWMGKPALKFNPCDYAGYSDNPEKNRYNKQTWLWGKFNALEKKYLSPLQKEFPGHINLGGKSEKTKMLRSITPDGFARAFYESNH